MLKKILAKLSVWEVSFKKFNFDIIVAKQCFKYK